MMKSYILIFVLSFAAYSQQDSTIIPPPLEQTNMDSILIDENLQQDSLITDIPLEQDTVTEEEQDSLITETPADSVQVDSLITEDIHPQDISDKSGYVIENIGKWGKLRIYGSMRLNGAYDLNGLTNTNGFSTYDIPVGEESIDQARFFMAPYQSRLGIEITRSGLLSTLK